MEEGQLKKNLADLGSEVPPVDLICFCGSDERSSPAPVIERESVDDTAASEEPAAEEQVAEKPEEVVSEEGMDMAAAYIERTDEIEEPENGRGGRLNIPRIVTIAVGIIIIGFIAWWVIIDRSIRDKSDANRRTELVQKQRDVRERTDQDEIAGEITAGVPADSVRIETPAPAVSAPERQSTPAEPEVQDETGSVDGQATEQMSSDETEADVGARYAIHVASFKDIARAGREKEYFEKKGYTVRIIAKEIRGEEWLRILVGEYATREEAIRVRAELMDLSGIGYAQIIELEERE